MPLLGIVLRALPLLHRVGADTGRRSEEPEPIQTKVPDLSALICNECLPPILQTVTQRFVALSPTATSIKN